jgi:hypothetical protein
MPRPDYHSGIKWTFCTKRFEVTLRLERDHNYRYDGDDENGETQAALDSGEYVAFDSIVTVKVDGEFIASDSLGSSVYSRDTVAEFWTAHRDPNAMNRNSSIMRASRGHNVAICHYFPGMVTDACKVARMNLTAKRKCAEAMPRVREVL